MSNSNKKHLGDGVYASFDGWQIWLSVHDHSSDCTIALEPETFASLVEYQQTILASQDTKQATQPPLISHKSVSSCDN